MLCIGVLQIEVANLDRRLDPLRMNLIFCLNVLANIFIYIFSILWLLLLKVSSTRGYDRHLLAWHHNYVSFCPLVVITVLLFYVVPAHWLLPGHIIKSKISVVKTVNSLI